MPVLARTDIQGGRVLAFANIHNFRDYGGYAAAEGRLRAAYLYRSAQHRGADAADLEWVNRLGLVAVIDLRGDSERQVSPCPRHADFAARIVFSSEETAGLAPHVAAADRASTPEQARRSMVSSYAEMPFRPRLLAVLGAYFEVLAEEAGPTLIHCMAGKDRTGLAVALFHALVGVHRDDMMEDYLLTNEAGRVDERIAAGAIAIRKLYGADVSDAAARELMSVRPDYLEAAFQAIVARHGSVATYLAEQAGVTPERRARIIANCLV